MIGLYSDEDQIHLVKNIVVSLDTAKAALSKDPLKHSDILGALDAMELLITPMVQLRRKYVIDKDGENMLKAVAWCQYLNAVILFIEVMHTLAHLEDAKIIDKNLFKLEMNILLDTCGIDTSE